MYIEEKIQQSVIWSLLLKIQRLILVATNIIVITILGVVIIARYILKVNVLGYDELTLIGAFWMYFIGSAYASYEETHITADILSQFVSHRKKQILAIFSKIVQVLLGFPMIYLSYELLLWDVEMNPSTIDWGIPYLIPQSAIFCGFVLMTFYSFVYLIRDIRAFTNVSSASGISIKNKDSDDSFSEINVG